jgi:hypothetical protein
MGRLAEGLGALVAEVPDGDDAAHAVAATLDQRFSATFCEDWIAVANGPFDLADGDLVPFRVGEAIEDLDGDRVVHLYQDGPFRLAAAVCEDLLDADVEVVLERMAVNLLLVPAMSSKTSNFPLAVARLLHTAQTVTVVANCPLVEDGLALAHCSLTGRPTADADPVASWPLGGHHARPPAGSVWVAHPLPAGPPSGHPLVA